MEDPSAEPLVSIDFVENFTTDVVFSTRDSLLEWVRGEAAKLGFVIVITRSDKRKLLLGCERGGVYKRFKKHSKYQDTKFRKCECPFRLRGYFLSSGVWHLNVLCGKHNHEITEGHPIASRLNVEEKKLIYEMTNNMVLPKDILVTLKKQRADNVITIKQIYNARRRYNMSIKKEADGVREEDHEEISITEEMEAIQACFDSADYNTKIYIKEQLRQIAFPETVSPCLPPEKENENPPFACDFETMEMFETTSPCPPPEKENGNPPLACDFETKEMFDTTSPCPLPEKENGNPPLACDFETMEMFETTPSWPPLEKESGNLPLACDFETMEM